MCCLLEEHLAPALRKRGAQAGEADGGSPLAELLVAFSRAAG